MVREELKRIMGIEAQPLLSRLFRWEKANPQYVIGHEKRLFEIDRLLEGHPGIYLAGSAYRGVGIPDCVHQGASAADEALQFAGSG